MRKEKPASQGDSVSFELACLPVGNAWTDATLSQFRQLLSGLPAKVRIRQEEPVLSETDILDRYRGRTGFGDPLRFASCAARGFGARLASGSDKGLRSSSHLVS